MEKSYELLKKLSLCPGVPGQEKQVKNLIKEELKDLKLEMFEDNLGSLIVRKKQNGPKIMIAGHMDEVGLLVTQIDKDGFVRFQTLGGWYNQVMLAQVWDIHTKNEIVTAVTGVKPPHLLNELEKKQTVKITDMYLDIGVNSKEEALKLGVRPGQMVTPHASFKVMGSGKHLLSKAWDNRIGSAVVIEVLKRLKESNNDIYGAFTVMEEVGLRGAKTSSYMVHPEVAIAIDSGIAADVPGGVKEEQQLGKGPQILLYDSGLIPNQVLRNFVIEVAKEEQIMYQEAFIQKGRTDAGFMHLAHEGALGLSICIPTRNLHTHTSIIHYDDFENTVKLLVKLLPKLTKERVNDLLNQ